ncbi:MAG TPA: ATP-binding protein, partial [Ktedonobacterales bacterium]|nr:ATP-binding protein [Ktedonobacterales bacterium]
VGNGLGLYLCRFYAEAMHGKIWVESNGVEGEGSTFFLRLPTPPSIGADNVSQSAQGSPDPTEGGVE